MILAAAQTKPVSQNAEKNIEQHVQLIELASQQGVQLIIFPEMSLTGYERALANQLAFTKDDPRLTVFKEKAVAHQMVIVVGAPVKIESKLHIASFIFSPDNTMSIYTKQFLHEGEEQFFSPGLDLNLLVKLENEKVSFAICSDIANPRHPENASKNNTTLYVAGIFYTPNGIADGYQRLSSYAKKYTMNVLMANYSGRSCKYESAGQSAFWNSKGELVGNLEANEEALLVVEQSNGIWKTTHINCEQPVGTSF